MTVFSEFMSTYAATTARHERVRRTSIVATILGRILGVIAGTTVKAWRGFKPVALSVFGLGMLVGAAFTLGLGWGLAAAGVSLLVLEWRINA